MLLFEHHNLCLPKFTYKFSSFAVKKGGPTCARKPQTLRSHSGCLSVSRLASPAHLHHLVKTYHQWCTKYYP